MIPNESRQVGFALIALFLIFAFGCGGGGNDKTTETDNILASSLIGISGGIVEVSDSSHELNGVSIVVPPNALDTDLLITVAEPKTKPSEPAFLVSNGPAIKLGPSGTKFKFPVQITIPYNPNVVNEDEIDVRVYDEELYKWLPVELINHDKQSNKITVQVYHFSILEIFGLSAENPELVLTCVSALAEVTEIAVKRVVDKGQNSYEYVDMNNNAFQAENDYIMINNYPHCIKKVRTVSSDSPIIEFIKFVPDPYGLSHELIKNLTLGGLFLYQSIDLCTKLSAPQNLNMMNTCEGKDIQWTEEIREAQIYIKDKGIVNFKFGFFFGISRNLMNIDKHYFGVRHYTASEVWDKGVREIDISYRAGKDLVFKFEKVSARDNRHYFSIDPSMFSQDVFDSRPEQSMKIIAYKKNLLGKSINVGEYADVNYVMSDRCGGSDPVLPTYNVNGTWEITQTATNTCSDFRLYENGVYYPYSVTQNGNELIINDPIGNTYFGSRTGNTGTWSGAVIYETGDYWNENVTVVLTSDTTLTGTAEATFTFGVWNCRSNATFTGQKY